MRFESSNKTRFGERIFLDQPPVWSVREVDRLFGNGEWNIHAMNESANY